MQTFKKDAFELISRENLEITPLDTTPEESDYSPINAYDTAFLNLCYYLLAVGALMMIRLIFFV